MLTKALRLEIDNFRLGMIMERPFKYFPVVITRYQTNYWCLQSCCTHGPGGWGPPSCAKRAEEMGTQMQVVTGWLPSGGDPVPPVQPARFAYSQSRPRLSPGFTSGEACVTLM